MLVVGHDELVLLDLSFLQIYWDGFFLAVALAASGLLASRDAGRVGIERDQVYDYMLLLVPSVVMGGRIGYVLQNLPHYLTNPVETLEIWHGGLSFHGGAALAVLAGIWFTRRRRIRTWLFADLVAPFGALGEAIARVGCDVFGKEAPAWLPWAVTTSTSPVPVHPQQAYSVVLNYLAFIYLWRTRCRTSFDGEVFVRFLALAGVSRFVIEFSRTGLAMGPLSVGQWVSVAMTGVAVVLMARARRAVRAGRAGRDSGGELGGGARAEAIAQSGFPPGGEGGPRLDSSDPGQAQEAQSEPRHDGFPVSDRGSPDLPHIAAATWPGWLEFSGWALGLVAMLASFFLRFR